MNVFSSALSWLFMAANHTGQASLIPPVASVTPFQAITSMLNLIKGAISVVIPAIFPLTCHPFFSLFIIIYFVSYESGIFKMLNWKKIYSIVLFLVLRPVKTMHEAFKVLNLKMKSENKF